MVKIVKAIWMSEFGQTSSWACYCDGTSRSAVIICVNGTCVSAYDKKTLVMTLMQDNESVIKIQTAGQRNKQIMKHLTVRLWWAQEQVEAGLAKIEWIGTKEMLADFLTKALHGVAFKYCWNKARGNLNAF